MFQILQRTYQGHIKGARNYIKKCSSGEGKTVVSVIIHAMERVIIKLMCKNKRDKVKFIASGKCTNKGKNTASKCWPKMVSQMTAMANGTESKNKFPLLCWSVLSLDTGFNLI